MNGPQVDPTWFACVFCCCSFLGDEILTSFVAVLLNKPWFKDPYQPITRRKWGQGLNHGTSQVIGQPSDWWLSFGNLLFRHTSSWESLYNVQEKCENMAGLAAQTCTFQSFSQQGDGEFFARLCYQECFCTNYDINIAWLWQRLELRIWRQRQQRDQGKGPKVLGGAWMALSLPETEIVLGVLPEVIVTT